MLKIDYTQYPGRKLEPIDFEIDKNIEPIISIISPYYNSQKYIDETANSILNQTFPYWEWIIVDDGSQEEGKQKLEEIAKRDDRIKIYYKQNEGAAVARDYGVEKTNEKSKYIMFLDSDDVINKTYLECCYWALETNPKASWAYTDVVNFEGQNFLWRKWYNPDWEQDENILTMTAMVKKSDFKEVGGFGLKEKKVYEDWCLWLKFIRAEKFPVRIGSLLTWYRMKPKEESELKQSNQDNKKRAMKLVNNIKRDIVYTKQAVQYPGKEEYKWDEIVDEQKSIVKVKQKQNKKIKILMLIPWMVTGGADKFNLDLISKLDKEKYEFIAISTLPSTNEWRQDFEKYATVYDLTTFLDRKNWPSFVNYIIEKNNINIIFNTNNQFGYSLLPYLKARYPEKPIIDYVHMEEWYWRNGGFSRDSSLAESVIDKTYTCNGNSEKIFKKHFGRKEKEVETVYIGVDEKKFNPELFKKEDILKEFKITPNGKFIISYICRIADQKRPFLLVEILKELSKRRDDFLAIIAGEGPLLQWVKNKIKKYHLQDKVIFLGNVKETAKVYKISDVTVNCSIKEGLALTSYESLSMGVPVVSCDVGGQKELINKDVGVIVPCLQKEKDILNYNYKKEEILNYVEGIEKVLNNIETYKNACRKRILDNFTIDKMIERMDEKFQNVKQNPNKEKIENGYGLQKNINVTKNLISEYFLESKNDYEWMSEQFNSQNIHIIMKYDKKAKKAQFYEHTLEYKLKHPIVVVLRKIGIYDKLKQLIGWERRR